MIREVVLVSPRGHCAGVVRAIASVERALTTFGPPVFVRRAIVHNSHVVARFAAAGAIFVKELDEVPEGAVVVFSAHGVAPSVRERANEKHLRVVDATCPLVAKIHREVLRYRSEGRSVVLVGRSGHDEVIGTLGQAPGVRLVENASDVAGLRIANPQLVACVTQTTLGPADVEPIIDQLRERFPALSQPAAPDICYATRNRQAALAWLADNVDVVLVIGDKASSNSQRLVEAARAKGAPAHLIGSLADLQESWLTGACAVGVTSGASTPDDVVQDVVAYFRDLGAVVREERALEEAVTFALPHEVAV